MFYAPTPQFHLYVLTKNDTNWTAAKYFRSRAGYTDSKAMVADSIRLSSSADIMTMFSRLEQNNFSSLPDQESLGSKYYADGDLYTLTFKNGATFRSYSFNNPELFKEVLKTFTSARNTTTLPMRFTMPLLKDSCR